MELLEKPGSTLVIENKQCVNLPKVSVSIKMTPVMKRDIRKKEI